MAADEAQVSYEDLALLEDEFEEVDSEIMRKQYELTKPLYTKRATAITKIPSFWALVLEQAPPEIDQFIQPSDSRIFAESLLNLTVTRPELDAGGADASPRSLKIRFEFKENEDFEDTVLEKEFWYRRAKDGWVGLVSEPVKVHWKKGKDLTEGLGDAAIKLWEARKKGGDMLKKEGKEYDEVKKLVEHLQGGASTSFFTWFGWVSGRRWVSAEESAAAQKEYREKIERRKKGEKVEEPEEDEENEEEKFAANDDSDVEVHEAGEELAIGIAEEVWPNAIKFFTQAQEIEEMSDLEFEDDDEEDDDDEAEGEPVDIRALVQDKGKTRKRMSDGPGPSKKAKKAS
ncbi:hypothetical protein PRZ48_007552 [Zasmidium cellare]|uniref:Nap family protein n=1 Tax=Zasmidium cellare TaxID=395010 RepID=A0ABR0ELS4_ZASCE|nr:hypothetical protein PRZ48_007552 [Zasmidium cellare]